VRFFLFCAVAMAAPVDFNRDIRPILSDNCFQCHGPDEKARMVGLRVDTKEGALSAIVPGDPSASKLFQRITHSTKALRMPPVGSGRTLTERQLDFIKRWIAEGARWNTHWSYVPPQQPALPAVKLKTWPRNPIDHFVLARLEQEGLKPSPETDRVTLLRRVTLDLTGLPPTTGDVREFLSDKSPGAYERVVDRLLQSPRYGEKMAMLWLDLSRYADTHGYHIDSHRDMWPWRDWVIRSFNENKRFDAFLTEQLAGDLLPNATPEQKLATGFNRNHMINFEGGAIAEEYLNEYLVDRVETTSNVFMGMTMGCARCHDHKYDPISQRDFYRFYAFFNGVEEEGLDGRRGNAKPFLTVSSQGQIAEIESLEKDIKAATKQLAAKDVDQAQQTWEKTVEPAASVQSHLANGLLAHYEFDGSFADSSGRYLHARSAGNEPGFIGGFVGKAVSLNVEDRLAFPARLLDFTKPFTLAFHIRPTHERTFRWFEKPDAGIEMSSEGSRYVPYYKRGAPVHLVLGGVKLKTREPVLFAAWNHVTLMYLGSGGAAGFRLFLNGKASALEVLAEGKLPAMNGADPLAIRDLQGQLDDLRFYSRVLEPAEIDSLALHLPAARTVEIELAKRSRDEKDRLRAYFLAHWAQEPYRSQYAELKKMETLREFLANTVPTSMVMAEAEKPRDTFLLGRGDYRNKAEKVSAAVPSALPPLPPGAPENRLGLSRWLTDPSHPLTARVTINRFWQTYFGNGIVKTSEDFGSQGEAPSHPELLDWLATEFIRSGWDVQAMQKMIVTSATYRQASKAPAELRERDPENRLLARMSRFRMPAEMVRDNALFTGGLLNQEIGGRSVFPYQPPALWDEMAFGREFTAQRYVQSTGKDLYRRSMYTFWKRTVPPAALSTFDAPDREKCTSRRPVTNTPLQALVLWNDPTYVEAARNLAQRMLRESGPRIDDRISYAYREVVSRPPSKTELAVVKEFAGQQMAAYSSNREAALKLLRVGDSKFDSSLNPAELAAWTNVASMILNLDEAITKE